jgi:hypothetical protein
MAIATPEAPLPAGTADPPRAGKSLARLMAPVRFEW